MPKVNVGTDDEGHGTFGETYTCEIVQGTLTFVYDGAQGFAEVKLTELANVWPTDGHWDVEYTEDTEHEVATLRITPLTPAEAQRNGLADGVWATD